MLRERAAPDLPGVLDKAVELAKDGDRTMIKLLLELHMAKGVMEKENAVEKVEINISTQAPMKTVSPRSNDVIDAEVVDKNG